MSLRSKCAVLLIAFELTLAATLIVSVRHIGSYFDAAAQSFARSSTGIADIGRLHTLTRNQITQLLRFVRHPAAAAEARRLSQILDRAAESLVRDLNDHWPEGHPREEFSRLRDDARRASTDFLTASTVAGSTDRRFDPSAHLALDSYLNGMESKMLGDVCKSAESTLSAQKRAAMILSINMLVGAALGIFGLFLVRRWVLLPLQELKRATDEIGKGNLEHRAVVNTHDEMAQLAAALNNMSADLARIQRQMVNRERLAAKGELMSYVAHNIRNPLAGIRGLADACRRRIDPASPLKTHHDEIIAAIDRFQHWLREIEQTCAPLDLHPEPVDLREIVSNVVDVFRPMAQRRRVSIEALNGGGPYRVTVDARHFEQALAAVIGNAVEAVGENGRVRIDMEMPSDMAQWCLSVADNGPGIPPDIGQRVFEPSFTTKRTGHGLGLALARRVAELHGGQLNFECPAGQGTVFQFQMPIEVHHRGTEAQK